MRTEDEMHDLVVAKVAAHRRRRTLLATAGGGVAVVLLLVAVAAGATSSGPDEGVKAGPGDPTSTTEAPTTEPRMITVIPREPLPSTTSAPADTTTTTTEAPPATEPETTTTTTAPPPTTTEPPVVWPTQLTRSADGDMIWGVYLAVANQGRDPSFDEADARLKELGYNSHYVGNDLGCDNGSIAALGLDPELDWYGVAIHFATQAEADRFVELFVPEVVGVALIEVNCAH